MLSLLVYATNTGLCSAIAIKVFYFRNPMQKLNFSLRMLITFIVLTILEGM